MNRNICLKQSLFFLLFFVNLDAITKKHEATQSSRLDHRALKSPEQKDLIQNVILATPGTELGLSGQISQEHIAIRNGYSLNREVSDWIWKFRQRIDLTWHSKFFGENKEKPAAQAVISLLNMHWWKEAYSNLYLKSEPTIIDYQSETGYLVTPDATLDPLITPFNNAMISTHIPVISFTQAWLGIYFDQIATPLKNKPSSFKIGYFPYKLGRGISLGEADEGGVQEFGYQLSQLPFASPFFSPGILWHGTITPHIGYEFYYTLLQKRYNAPFEREAINFKSRTNKSSLPQFGKETSSQLWAGKVILAPLSASKKKLYTEAYFSWLHSTLNTASKEFFITDRDSNICTFGIMFDCRYKQLECNIECASQIGSIAMHALDKNQLKLHKNQYGNASESFTKVLAHPIQFNTGAIAPNNDQTFLAPATSGLLAIIDNVTQYELSSEIPLHDVTGNTIIDLQDGSFQSQTLLEAQFTALKAEGTSASAELISQIPSRYIQCFNAPDRLRKKYQIDLHGFSVLCDLKYSMQRFPCAINFAAAYISGDRNPFIKETDCSYNGFLPLKDIHYKGHFVKSLALLGARIIPRPCDGLWHQQDSGNLSYFGLGFTCKPLKTKNMLLLETNFLTFFQPTELPIARIEPTSTTKKYASTQLGNELNASIIYTPLENISIIARSALFFPGRLYKDLETQTLSFMTINGTPKKTRIYSDIAWGYQIKIAYHF